MSDYLWDKSGEPDPEVERLEKLLRPLAHRPLPLIVPARQRRRRARVWIAAAMATAAVAALIVLAVTRPWRAPVTRPAPPQIVERPVVAPPRASWAVMVTGVGATVDGQEITGEARLPVGASLDTGGARVRLSIAGVGTIDLSPDTRARIVVTGADHDELALDRGTLGAEIHAAPRHFAVVTPYARAIDLGCAFTLALDSGGQGRLVVTAGAVGLSNGGAREVVVPAGAECDITARGPATPLTSGAAPDFRAALARYDGSPRTLRALLATARPPDRVTLRALLVDAGREERRLLQRRMGELDAAEKAPVKSNGKIKRATGNGAKKTPPASAPAQKTPPAKKAEPTKINHDALKGLERSIQ